MGADKILCIAEASPHVALVTLNRPDAANALSTALANGIISFFSSLGKNIRVIILTGTGRAFCAGADLKERQGMNETAWETQHQALRGARDTVLACPIPIIAAVNGAAYGGGFELALACDFIYAADTARFALPEVSLGIMPGMGGTQTLPRAVGARCAAEMLFTGAPITAQEAFTYGLVNCVYPPDALLHNALATAQNIAANAPLSVRAIKSVLRKELDFARELAAYRPLLTTQDRMEGISAFNQKRKPEFTGI